MRLHHPPPAPRHPHLRSTSQDTMLHRTQHCEKSWRDHPWTLQTDDEYDDKSWWCDDDDGSSSNDDINNNYDVLGDDGRYNDGNDYWWL